MFSFFSRKKSKSQQVTTVPVIECDWLQNHVSIQDKLPRVNWQSAHEFVEQNLSSQDPDILWTNVARKWGEILVEALRADYQFIETENFILISAGEQRFNSILSAYLERCRKRILLNSEGISADEGFGKYVVIVFSDVQSYYDYVAYFYGTEVGTYGLSSGMFINDGYGHFVLVDRDINEIELIIAHEMTHALLSHLNLPAWVDEGMAMNMESLITGARVEGLTESIFEGHLSFWNDETIQEFWRGESFFRDDEGQRLSYQMAQLLISRLAREYDAFCEFINRVDRNDGGENAMQEVYGISLGDLAASFLGEGEWQPEPKTWN